MQAVIATEQGPVVDNIPKPIPNADEILVRVHAAALNRVDLGMSTGSTHGPHGGVGKTLGLEFAGEVVAVGHNVDRWRVGDRIMANGAGAFAEYAAIPASVAFPIAPEVSWQEAAALPVGLQTMHDALVARGGFVTGHSVLVQGATSAMGLIGIQIAKELGASIIIGTTTNEDKLPRLREFGADIALNSTNPNWTESVLEATEGHGVDVILDLVSGNLVTDNLRATRIGGRIVNIGRVGGEKVTLDLNLHSMRRITYVGTTFRTRTQEEVAEAAQEADKALGVAVAAGQRNFSARRRQRRPRRHGAQHSFRKVGATSMTLHTPATGAPDAPSQESWLRDRSAKISLIYRECLNCGRESFPPQAYGCLECGTYADDQFVNRHTQAAGTLVAQVEVNIHPGHPSPYRIGEIAITGRKFTVQARIADSEVMPGHSVSAVVADGKDVVFAAVQEVTS